MNIQNELELIISSVRNRRLTRLLKCRLGLLLEKWFPTSYKFRMIKTTVAIDKHSYDYVTEESFEIIGVWDDQGKYFWRKLFMGYHRMDLPEHTSDGWTHFLYEVQRRPSENLNARWKSLGYVSSNS